MSLDILEEFVRNPEYRDVLKVVKSMRNGVVYGGRIRFAHSLVINLLFRRNVPILKRLTQVLKMTKDHALILAVFAMIYKFTIMTLDEVLEKRPINEFLAGCIGGAIVYGNQTSKFNHSIAHQITLYCAARVMLGLGKLLAYKLAKLSKDHQLTLKSIDKKHLRGNIQKNSWFVFASLSWGLVMYLHRFYPSFLQHGLESSMVYIYDDLKWDDLRSFLGI